MSVLIVKPAVLWEDIEAGYDICYICLEKCNEVSPCECKKNVHLSCLTEFIIKNKLQNHCTICKKGYNGIAITMELRESIIDSIDSIDSIEERNTLIKASCLKIGMSIMTIALFWAMGLMANWLFIYSNIGNKYQTQFMLWGPLNIVYGAVGYVLGALCCRIPTTNPRRR